MWARVPHGRCRACTDGCGRSDATPRRPTSLGDNPQRSVGSDRACWTIHNERCVQDHLATATFFPLAWSQASPGRHHTNTDKGAGLTRTCPCSPSPSCPCLGAQRRVASTTRKDVFVPRNRAEEIRALHSWEWCAPVARSAAWHPREPTWRCSGKSPKSLGNRCQKSDLGVAGVHRLPCKQEGVTTNVVASRVAFAVMLHASARLPRHMCHRAGALPGVP